MFCLNSPDGSCLNEVSIAQSIISQALPALSPRLNLSFSPKISDRTRLVDSQNSHLEMNKFQDKSPNGLQASLSQLEATINASRVNENEDCNETEASENNNSNKVETVVSPNKWPLKPGVLVHVNSNHTLSPKNPARLQRVQEAQNEESNLGLLERHKSNDDIKNKTDYSKKNGKPRNAPNVVTGIFRNLRRKSDSSDDESGKYKKINKTNKRAVSLMNINKNYGPKRIRSLFQSETPNVIVTEGGSYNFYLKLRDTLMLQDITFIY